MQVSQGSGVCAALCIRRTLCRHVTIGTPMVIFAVWLSFDCFFANGILYQSSKKLKTIGVQIITGLPRLYNQCTNGVPIVKKQSKQHKNDHWCTSRHMSTKTLPTVYQQCTNKSQKTDKTAKMTIGVPIVTGLPRLYQQCNNSVPIVNNYLAIANRSRVSCAHNTSRAVIGLNITP